MSTFDFTIFTISTRAISTNYHCVSYAITIAVITTCRLTLYHRIKLKKKKRKRSKETHQRRRFDQNAFVKEEYNQFHHLVRQPDISRCIEFQAALQELTAKKIETNPSNSIRIGCRDKNTRESCWNNGLCNIHVQPRATLAIHFGRAISGAILSAVWTFTKQRTLWKVIVFSARFSHGSHVCI